MANEGEVGDIKARHLFRYWTEGPGAAKINWGVPHDFDRCVVLLSKYFPQDPKGLCANLHHRAIGVWPGQEDGGRSGHHLSASGEEPEALVASAPSDLDTMQPMKWMGPLAQIGTWTTDITGRRMFAAGSITNRELPLPLLWKPQTGGSGPHGEAVVVGRITGLWQDEENLVGHGDLFTADVVDQVHQMAHLAKAGVLGLSIDPGGPVDARVAAFDTADGEPEEGVVFDRYHMGGATAVPLPAFAGQRMLIWNDDDASSMDHFDEFNLDDSLAYNLLASAEFTVLGGGWEGFPVAARQARWNADEAILRINQWAGGDPKKLASIYLWRSPKGGPADTSSYRLPIADIIKGEPVIIYSAVYHAAALVQGGHGGLPDMTDQERVAVRGVLNKIYAKVSDALGVQIPAPWNRTPTKPPKTRMEASEVDSLTAAVNSSGWSSLPIADDDTTWRAGDAMKQLRAYAGIGGSSPNWQKFGNGFLWHASNAQTEGDFKLPVCYVTDGKLTIVPRAVNAVASRLSGTDIPDADKTQIQGIIDALQKRIKATPDTDDKTKSVTAAAPLAPPRRWFENPNLANKTKITVEDDGRVFGHLADWSTCHIGIQGKCVNAPHSHNEYADFHVGQVVTAEGDMLDVGNLTANTGHAPLSLQAGATKAHYDDTGTQVAVVRAGEDEFGIWVAGALTPEMDIASTAALMRRSPLSGDWRTIDGKLSLVAALHVNRPGFQIKPMFSLEGEEVVSLQAAGVLHENLENTTMIQLPSGGVINHTPQFSTPVVDPVDEQARRAVRLDLLLSGAPRAERIQKLLGGK